MLLGNNSTYLISHLVMFLNLVILRRRRSPTSLARPDIHVFVTHPCSLTSCSWPRFYYIVIMQRGESRTFETMAENQLQQQLSADWTCTRRRVGIRKGARESRESAIREWARVLVIGFEINVKTYYTVTLHCDRTWSQKFMTLTGELSWQHLRRSAVPGIWFARQNLNGSRDLTTPLSGMPYHPQASNCYRQLIYLPNLKSLSALTTKIWKTIQNVENGVVWGS